MKTQIDWNGYARDYDALCQLWPYKALLRTVVDKTLSAARDGARILDAGCGTGNLIRSFRTAHVSAGLIGIDRSPEMLARAHEKCPGVPLAFGDLDRPLPFHKDTFDLLTCVNALYAVEDPARTLAEFRRVLRPDGTLVLATPRAGYENGLILKAHCGSMKPDAHWLDAHASPGREARLIKEALGDTPLARQMLSVAKVNRAIACNARFHFLTAHELFSALTDAGFTAREYHVTYAGQTHLVLASTSTRRR